MKEHPRIGNYLRVLLNILIPILTGLLIGLVLSLTIFFLYKKLLEKHTKRSFDDLSQKTLVNLMPTLMDLARKELGMVRDEINKDVEKEKSMISETLTKLEQGIREKQEDLKKMEAERNRQFGTLAESLKSHKEVTERLQDKTEHLNKILSNNKLRGDWGERVAEDILHHAGFIEGVHYRKQLASASGTIPDFTLLLPNNRTVNIDAKFPLANLRMVQAAQTPAQRIEYTRKFGQDVKQKIREVTTRAYISEEENTLDYVILFVPSERVYSFINDQLTEVVDHAMSQKVLITSPSSFYATIRIIMESYRYFAYEKNIKEVLLIVSGFIENFRRFQDEFSGFDDSIMRLRTAYDKIAETRYKKMNVQIKKIEKLEQIDSAGHKRVLESG